MFALISRARLEKKFWILGPSKEYGILFFFAFPAQWALYTASEGTRLQFTCNQSTGNKNL